MFVNGRVYEFSRGDPPLAKLQTVSGHAKGRHSNIENLQTN
jgi:hypothetical protein